MNRLSKKIRKLKKNTKDSSPISSEKSLLQLLSSPDQQDVELALTLLCNINS